MRSRFFSPHSSQRIHVDNDFLFFFAMVANAFCVISAQCSERQRGEKFKQARTNGRRKSDPVKGGQMMSPRLTTIHHTTPSTFVFPAQIQAHLIPKRTCSPNKEWATAHALWHSGQVWAMCAQRANWTSDHCHRHWDEKETYKKRYREEKSQRSKGTEIKRDRDREEKRQI